MDRFRIILLLFTVTASLVACGREESNDLWGTQIEYIQWGMGSEEVQEYYGCTEIVQEDTYGCTEIAQDDTSNYQYLKMEDSVKIYGCPVEITLVFETGYGLIGIKGQTEDVEKLEKNIDKVLGEYRSGTEWSNGVIWQSEPVMEQYTYQQLEDAYNQVYGDGVFTEDFIKGILGSPFVSCQLWTEGERRGKLWMNGSKRVYINDLMIQSR